MKETPTDLQRKMRAWILRLTGAMLFGIGMLVAFLGPLEMFCFYLFSEGGLFHYDGFRFGSLMFGNIAAQISAYYFIAAILIPIGFGTMRLRSWARHLSLAILRFWMVAGLPLIAAFFFVLVSSKDISLPIGILAGLLLAASYLLLPILAHRFFENPETRMIFRIGDADLTWIERMPIPVLGLCYVFAFFILILHTQIFFNGMFPLFGFWLSGLVGIIMIALSMIILSIILWGTIQVQPWAWWSGLIFFCMMSISYIITLVLSSWNEMLVALNTPAFEMQFLQQMPLQGYHLAVLAGIPFLLALASIVRARSYFISQDQHKPPLR